MLNEKKLSVVIAEDEFLISVDVAETAKAAGFTVAGIAPDGEKALELVRELKPDAVILDIKMPGLDGLQTARRLLAEHPMPVVIMSAYESEEFLAAARDVGAGGYLVKPPEAMTLRRAVELAVARHKDLMEVKRLNEELTLALAKVRSLEGLLPICASCKKIRDGEGRWHQVEAYISNHTDVMFSHGVCPDCVRELYPDFSD